MADRRTGDGLQGDAQEWASGLETLSGKEFSLPNLSCKLFEFWVDGDLNKYPSAFETTTKNALAYVSKNTILMARTNTAALYQAIEEARSVSNLPKGQESKLRIEKKHSGPNFGGSAHNANDAKCFGLIPQFSMPPRRTGSKRNFTLKGKRPPRSPEVPQRKATTQHLGYVNVRIRQRGPRTEAAPGKRATMAELQLEDKSSEAEATPFAHVGNMKSADTDGINKKQKLYRSNLMGVMRL